MHDWFSARNIAYWAIAPNNLRIRFFVNFLAAVRPGIKNARPAGSGGIIIVTLTPFLEGLQVKPMAGLLAPGRYTPFRLPIPMNRDSGSTQVENGVTSYSGGTAPDSHRLPFSVPIYRDNQTAFLDC